MFASLFCLLVGLSPAIPNTVNADATYELKVATQAPAQSMWGRALLEVSEKVEKATNGQVRIKCYANGIQGSEKTVLRKIRVQQLHGAAFLGSGFAQICKDSLVIQLPLLFKSEAEVEKTLEQLSPLLVAQCRKSGYEVLGWPHVGFSYLFSTKSVSKMAELRKAKPWLIENDRLSKELFRAVRVNPVAVSVADVLPGLQSGLLDTVFISPMGLIALQWHTQIRYRFDLAINYSVGVIVVSKRSWRKIPKDLQDKTREIFESVIEELNAKVHRQNREALSALEKRGVKVVSGDGSAREELKQATSQIVNELRGKEFSEEIYEALQKALESVRSGKK